MVTDTSDRVAATATPPIESMSLGGQEITTSLIEELRRQNTFESDINDETRKVVLNRVAALLNEFVRKVSLRLGMLEPAVKATQGKIFTFGSYRLGVHGPGSDIDVVCVVPKHVSRNVFFELFEVMLRNTDTVTQVSRIQEARVPIIKVKMSGISLDILCASMALSSIPADLDLNGDHLLRGLDQRCIRSIGGPRVAEEILRLVPNVQVFRESLRCIRLWARRRAIYSYVSGFLGGVAWAILVAHICQLYPNAPTGAVIYHFFETAYQWPWPKPVLLKPVENGPSHLRVWNAQRYDDDRSHRMPIITPAYPAICSTRTVTTSTQMIMTEEFKRGAEVVGRVMAATESWSELFASHDFFRKYEYYLEITTSTNSFASLVNLAQQVEGRMRQLVIQLENTDPPILAHPFSKGFDHPTKAQVDTVSSGGVTDEHAHATCSTTFFVGLATRSKQGGSVDPERTDISTRITEFTKRVQRWDGYDKQTMRIVVRHIKSASLPEYVFKEGEL